MEGREKEDYHERDARKANTLDVPTPYPSLESGCTTAVLV